jgi:hypothetical protein
MGKRSRARARQGRQPEPLPDAPTTDYPSPDGEQVLTLRGAMTAGTRMAYQRALSGEDRAPGAAREDAWQRAVELLFERLAVRWTIAGVETEGPKDLLARFRVAAQDERRWIRGALREHLAEHFPELPAP